MRSFDKSIDRNFMPGEPMQYLCIYTYPYVKRCLIPFNHSLIFFYRRREKAGTAYFQKTLARYHYLLTISPSIICAVPCMHGDLYPTHARIVWPIDRLISKAQRRFCSEGKGKKKKRGAAFSLSQSPALILAHICMYTYTQRGRKKKASGKS